MTVSDTSTPAEVSGGAPPDARRARRLGRIGLLVNQRIGGAHGLQKRYLDNESLGRAEVAALRKGANRAPGELPEIWELTRVEVPDGAGDAPTREEIAVHTAMTLYAVHQQSRSECMFVPGRGLGRAAHELVGTDEENPSARARFNALVTSTTVAELRHHLRNLVSLLRSRGIALDHAMLADDIVRFQRPGGAKSVRLVWARQYYSLPADGAVSAPGIDHDTTSTNHASTSEN
ncbi:type I-E CRISPR-associated protein Cse2/CasB [uncultured Actinomyces sp.]|uniref:type I-E CRISPR-associated protein Cse2/CasB n=1 Tax=uncultured Actinomyces sp. TaxID=249061 RepID=UPI0028EC6178|nr:type I-E CRISPR-associated protein Cse2/CasB [uncultured Actinomyces sp.]